MQFIPQGIVTTFAGNGLTTFSDGIGTAATFFNPTGLATDKSGNIYVSDVSGQRIRKISPSGVVSTLAGNGGTAFADGNGTVATFNSAYGIAVDTNGIVYVADSSNRRIRKIETNGLVSTFAGDGGTAYADGTGTSVSVPGTTGIAIDASGNLYATGNNGVLKITPSGFVSTFVGNGGTALIDGTGSAASFYNPIGITMDVAGNLFVADRFHHCIRKVTQAGVVTTFAGSGIQGTADGLGTAATFFKPFGVAIDARGDFYVTDEYNNLIRHISPDGLVTTLAGATTSGAVDGTGASARFAFPCGIAIDAAGNLFVADFNNNRIRLIR
jgi:sugar lactone lactonase YvrE